jgi:hypothetical protein
MTDLLAIARALPLPDAPHNVYHRVVSSPDEVMVELFGYSSNEPSDQACIAAGQEVGGMSGGNCWDGEARSYTLERGPCELLLLDALLEQVAPSMSFLHYRALLREVQDGTYTQREYYGNRTEYAYTYIPLSTVATRLTEWGYTR